MMRTDIEDVKCPQSALPGTRTPDIFTVMPRFPAAVCVVASGPNGRDPALRIPDSAFTIAVNSAITMPRRFSWWLAFDHRNVCHDFWETIELGNTRLLFGARLVNRLRLQKGAFRHIEPEAYFNYMPMIIAPTKLHPDWKLTPPEECLKPGLLRGGATASGVALQFAFYAGARDIILCGADFEGRGHHDGFNAPDPYDLFGGVWPYRDAMQNLIVAIQRRGTRVWTLSDTALDLPRWEE